jgi:hypothetical protein
VAHIGRLSPLLVKPVHEYKRYKFTFSLKTVDQTAQFTIQIASGVYFYAIKTAGSPHFRLLKI